MKPLAALLVAAAVAAGCRDDQGPVSGELAVRLSAPRPADRGIQLVVVGRVRRIAASPGSEYQVFGDTSANGDTAHVVVVAPVGSTLAAGELARILVDDTRQVRGYRAHAVALASSAYLPDDTSGVSLTVARP